MNKTQTKKNLSNRTKGVESSENHHQVYCDAVPDLWGELAIISTPASCPQ